jgi:hypothetical protein
MVPVTVAEMIKGKRLFGYQTAIANRTTATPYDAQARHDGL